jgi:hypothetical protein
MSGRMVTLIAVVGFAGPAQARPGPDVYVGDLLDMARYGSVGPVTAYAVGTIACNAGDAPVNWYGNTNQHPVIAQNLYRLKNGRFEQIGQSWAKHGFGSENASFCSTCQLPPGGFSQLGVGCSDAYDAGTNGFQSFLGPRSQVNPTTGVFPYPFTAPPVASMLDRRLQVATDDIAAAQNPGALYFAEGHYVTADDAQAGNGLNNATFRPVMNLEGPGNPFFNGAPRVGQPAIRAWAEADPTVQIVSSEYSDDGLTARFWVAGQATDNGNGTWHYEYAVYNLNSRRAGAGFMVPVPATVAVTNLGFHAPPSHSGEPYDNSPWTGGAGGGAAGFSPAPFTPAQYANTLRWGTLYNFRFDAAAPPVPGAATIMLVQGLPPFGLSAPGMPIPAGSCHANCDFSTTPPIVNVLDFACFVNRFAAGDPFCDCDHNNALNVNDFICFQAEFAAGCP